MDPLVREKTVKSWALWTQEDINEDRGVVDTVNALIVVSAFIAGIQAQMMSSLANLPNTSLSRVTNVLSFVGLLLDIIGTFLGVIHALLLQRRIQDNLDILAATADYKEKLDMACTADESVIQAEVNEPKLSYGGSSSSDVDKDSDSYENISKDMCAFRQMMERRFRYRAFRSFRDSMRPQRRPRTIIGVCLVIGLRGLIRWMFQLGRTPLVAMACGAVCIILETVFIAVDTPGLGREVWVSCVIVLAVVIFLSFMPLKIVYHQQRRDQAGERK